MEVVWTSADEGFPEIHFLDFAGCRHWVEPGSVILVGGELMPHARALIPKARLVPLDGSGAERESALYALVPGESSQPGAMVFAWPESAPLERLARSRHRVVSVVPLRAPAPPP